MFRNLGLLNYRLFPSCAGPFEQFFEVLVQCVKLIFWVLTEVCQLIIHAPKYRMGYYFECSLHLCLSVVFLIREQHFSRLVGKDSITDSIMFVLQLLSCSSWPTSTGPRPSRRRSAGCWLVLNRRPRGREMPQPKDHLSSVQVSGFPFLSFNVFVF